MHAHAKGRVTAVGGARLVRRLRSGWSGRIVAAALPPCTHASSDAMIAVSSPAGSLPVRSDRREDLDGVYRAEAAVEHRGVTGCALEFHDILLEPDQVLVAFAQELAKPLRRSRPRTFGVTVEYRRPAGELDGDCRMSMRM